MAPFSLWSEAPEKDECGNDPRVPCNEVDDIVTSCSTMPSRRPTAAVELPDLQAAFFARMGGRQQFQGLFEHLPGVCFFVKDAEGRFMAANALCLKRMGFRSEAEVIGKTDAEVHPDQLTRGIYEAYLRFIRSREPLADDVKGVTTAMPLRKSPKCSPRCARRLTS